MCAQECVSCVMPLPSSRTTSELIAAVAAVSLSVTQVLSGDALPTLAGGLI